MRSLLEFKEATIEELRSRLNKMGISDEDAATQRSPGPRSFMGENYRENIALITAALREREDQIEELQEKVAQASKLVT